LLQNQEFNIDTTQCNTDLIKAELSTARWFTIFLVKCF